MWTDLRVDRNKQMALGKTNKQKKNRNKNHTWNPQISGELPDALKLTSLNEVVKVIMQWLEPICLIMSGDVIRQTCQVNNEKLLE